VRVPYLVVHDRDAAPGHKPNAGERVLNAAILELAGPERTVELAPDFEAIAGLRGRSHKPQRAVRRFSALRPSEVPEPLRRVVERALDAAGGQPADLF
jgi:hypothetical protein